MRFAYINYSPTILLGTLILACIQSDLLGCSSEPSKEQTVISQQERAVAKRRQQEEDKQAIADFLLADCPKGRHKISIQFKNGASSHCVSSYESCIAQIVDALNRRVEFDPPLSAEEKRGKAIIHCQEAFSDLQSNASKPDVSYVPSQKEKAALNKGFTPLFYACTVRNTYRVKYLLENGANPNERTKEGNTPLLAAAAFGTMELITLLIDSGASINAKNSKGGMTPLMAASAFGNTETARALLERGADTKATNKKGLTAIMIAKQSKKNNPTLIEVLLNGGK